MSDHGGVNVAVYAGVCVQGLVEKVSGTGPRGNSARWRSATGSRDPAIIVGSGQSE